MRENEVNRVYDYCCKLLKVRDRSLYEIKSKLVEKGVPEKIITVVVQKLVKNNYLSEQRFVESYIKKNLNKAKSLALILEQLRQRYKVEEKVIQNLDLEKYKQLQLDSVVSYIKRRYKNIDLRKVYNFLYARGFDESEIEQILSVLKSENV